MDMEQVTRRKVAGIPVVYVLAVVAGIGMIAAFRMPRSADTSEELPTDAAATDDFGDGTDTDQPVFTANPVIYQPSGNESIAATPQEDTNELWGRRAVQWLVGNGFDIATATNAISKYLAGDTLSTEEGRARDAAIKQFGIPPEGLLPTNKVSTSTGYTGPATRQGTPPLTHKVKGKSDDSLGELARLYYGLDNADMRNLIRANNATIPAFPVKPGTSVRIPKRSAPKFYKATSAVNTLYRIASKNGTSAARVQALNPATKFPVKVGTSVRVA